MGNILSYMLPSIFGKEKRIVIQGPRVAGKTTLLYRLKLGQVHTTTLYTGFIVETVTYKKFVFSVWDTDSESSVPPEEFFDQHYQNTIAVIYVVDSNDRDKVEKARSELHSLTKHELLQDAAFLVLANKQDLPNALTPEKLGETLQLDRITQKHNIFGTWDGNGAYEALDWLSETLKQE